MKKIFLVLLLSLFASPVFAETIELKAYFDVVRCEVPSGDKHYMCLSPSPFPSNISIDLKLDYGQGEWGDKWVGYWDKMILKDGMRFYADISVSKWDRDQYASPYVLTMTVGPVLGSEEPVEFKVTLDAMEDLNEITILGKKVVKNGFRYTPTLDLGPKYEFDPRPIEPNPPTPVEE